VARGAAEGAMTAVRLVCALALLAATPARAEEVPYVQTPQNVVEAMLELAGVRGNDFLIDLGSGDGRIVITAARKYGASGVGIDYDNYLIKESTDNAAKAGVADRARFLKEDIFETDLSAATVVTMYLLPEFNIRLRPRLLELEPGTRIVSNSFRMEEWVPDAEETVNEGCESWCTALLWIIPARVEGTWKLAQGTLALTQAFQMVSGTLDAGSGGVTITEGRLRGDEIVFTANGTRYTGRVDGETMVGLMSDGKTNGTWSARRM